MKKYFFLVFMAISLSMSAQLNAIHIEFRATPSDLTATSQTGKRVDQNGKIAALIKIETCDTGFSVEGDSLGIVDSEQKDGEIWVWVPKHSQRITIVNLRLGIVDTYTYPCKIRSGKTYEMVLWCWQFLSYNPDEIDFENSHNVAIYDKNGNHFTTGLFISYSDMAYIRIRAKKEDKGYKQFTLTKSDKKEFTYMTTGESEIEPLYVK